MHVCIGFYHISHYIAQATEYNNMVDKEFTFARIVNHRA